MVRDALARLQALSLFLQRREATAPRANGVRCYTEDSEIYEASCGVRCYTEDSEVYEASCGVWCKMPEGEI